MERVTTGAHRPALWTPGDWNAFFGFGTNILVNMLVLTGLLRFVLKMPDSLVFGRILPALGLMMCLSTMDYAFLAYRLTQFVESPKRVQFVITGRFAASIICCVCDQRTNASAAARRWANSLSCCRSRPAVIRCPSVCRSVWAASTWSRRRFVISPQDNFR